VISANAEDQGFVARLSSLFKSVVSLRRADDTRGCVWSELTRCRVLDGRNSGRLGVCASGNAVAVNRNQLTLPM